MLQTKVAVSTRALLQRLNRKLAHQHKAIHPMPGVYDKERFGPYYMVDTTTWTVVDWRCDPAQLAQECGVLKPWEAVEEVGRCS